MGGCCLGPWLRAVALAACLGGLLPWALAAACLGGLHALALAACLGLGCVPWGAAPGLGGQPLALAACMPWPWLHAMALAACLGLGCVPWPSLLPCPQILSDFPKNEGFLEKEVIFPQRGRRWAPRGMPACTPRRIAPHRPALRRNWLVPFSIFVFLNSVHDFRGGFQQAVRRSEQF